MNATSLLSPQAVAFVSTPPGVKRLPVVDRENWLAMRRQDVTASVAAATLGIHPYQTPYGLWADKAGVIQTSTEETGAMLRGTLLEPVAIAMLKRERPSWRVDYPLGHYWRDYENRIGATPDALAIDPEAKGFGIVQIKSAEPSIFRREWRDEDGELQVPLWIAVQSLIEMKLTGASWGAVGVLRVGHGVEFDVIPIPNHEGVWSRLVDEVREFWRRVEENDPPAPDYGRDGALIAGLYAQDDGTEVDLSQDNRLVAILDERAELKAKESEGSDAAKKRRELDNEILAKLGPAARARIADGRTITAKTIKRSGYSVQPGSYRQIKVRDVA